MSALNVVYRPAWYIILSPDDTEVNFTVACFRFNSTETQKRETTCKLALETQGQSFKNSEFDSDKRPEPLFYAVTWAFILPG